MARSAELAHSWHTNGDFQRDQNYDYTSDHIMGGGSYEILLTKDAMAHIRSLDRKHHGMVFKVLRQQLSLEPFTEARNRKPLNIPAPFGAHWELRFGPQNRFRAFYALDGERGAVVVLAVGEKVRDRLRIAGREI